MKKTLYYLLFISLLFVSAVFFIACSANHTFRINAGHGYAEPYTPYNPGIRMKENGNLSQWTDPNRKAVWYLYQKAGTYDVGFLVKSPSAKEFRFEMKTTACDAESTYQPEDFSFSFKTKKANAAQEEQAFRITIPQTGYYRYELTAKSDQSGLTIDKLLFNGIGEAIDTTGFDTHATDYLSSPSVHLGFSSTAPSSKKYDWIYQEILVPEGYDPLYTYWMSLGFFRGYMGIQTNSENERRVLFSAWDAVDKDKFPNAPKEMLVSLVDKAEYTKANSFGNEGTGGQSYVGVGNPNTWKTGQPVKFLMNCREDGGITFEGNNIRHTIISAWYDAGDGWRYIASWRVPIMPGGKDRFDGFYSFLENYGYRNGQIIRKGYYYNAFGRDEKSKEWIHFNKVRFSNTDGKEGQRIDFEQGVAEEAPSKFYMVSGGYGNTKKTENEVGLIEHFPYLENLDITPFEKRVDEALVAEKNAREIREKMSNIQVKDKALWKVLDFTSEEIEGESNNNGRAKLIIDGNRETYWHSQWTKNTGEFPHRFVIDLGRKETINGFRISTSGGNARFPKSIVVEGSNKQLDIKDTAWENHVVINSTAPEETIYLLNLQKPVKYRYIRVSILDGFNHEVYTRLNEVDLF